MSQRVDATFMIVARILAGKRVSTRIACGCCALSLQDILAVLVNENSSHTHTLRRDWINPRSALSISTSDLAVAFVSDLRSTIEDNFRWQTRRHMKLALFNFRVASVGTGQKPQPQ